MNKEDRMLLVQDIMSRIPYNVKFYLDGMIGSCHYIYCRPKYNGNDIDDYVCDFDFFGDGSFIDVEHFKPILYPMSSMTEEQKREYIELLQIGPAKGIDYLNKHMFDYRGLIPNELAKDASKLNVY